jgi:2-polyprenyl-6-methoxyphenol hydroxylase-like FAD-dependent oxidoreductase
MCDTFYLFRLAKHNTRTNKTKGLSIHQIFQVQKLQLCIYNTTLEHFTKNTLRHKINMKPTCETHVVGNVTICGDAFHPTSPTFAHGGCMALEDGIVLARKLHKALKSKESKISRVLEHEQIHEALLDFH